MSTMQIGLAMFVGMLALMAVRVPIAIAMFVPGAVGYVCLSGWMPLLAQLKNSVYGRVSVYDLSVIPLFMLMGAMAVQGGLSKALFDFANALLGRFRGGMAMAGVLADAEGNKLTAKNAHNVIPARELAAWKKLGDKLAADWVKDTTAKGLDGAQLLKDARDLIAKYQAQ